MTKRQPGAGRKALSPADKRKNWNIMLSDAERTAIEQAADRAGDAPRVWARKMLLQAAREAGHHES